MSKPMDRVAFIKLIVSVLVTLRYSPHQLHHMRWDIEKEYDKQMEARR